MKKTYLNPTTDILSVELQQMIAASVEIGEGFKDGGGATSKDFNFLAFDDDSDTDDADDTSLPGFNVWED